MGYDFMMLLGLVEVLLFEPLVEALNLRVDLTLDCLVLLFQPVGIKLCLLNIGTDNIMLMRELIKANTWCFFMLIVT